jgi:hypothetical protein
MTMFRFRRLQETKMNATKTNVAASKPPMAAPKAPSHHAFQVRNRDGQKAIWTRIGSAWPHADGQGYNIQLDAVPIDGKISLRIPSEKDE